MFIRSLHLLALMATLSARGEVFHAQGEMAGEPTATGVLLQSRLTATPGLNAAGEVPGAAGVACFEWSAEEDFADARRTDWREAGAASDFIVRAQLEGLEPGRRYFYRLVFGEKEASAKSGPTREFKMLPTADATGTVSFCMGSCMNYDAFMRGKSNGGGPLTATDEDKRLGYPAFAAMAALRPDFFIGTGDIVYYDKPDKDSARALPELRKKWHEQFRFPRMVEFLARTPVYWSKDDHDFRFNDADLGGDRMPLPGRGIEVFREQMPVPSPTYRTHRVHRDVQLWFTEGRDFRSPNRMPDGPEKSLWGPEQRAWLERTLLESDAQWKILITPTPMVGPDDASKKDNHVNLGGFRHEADAFFAWAKAEGITNLLTFCGDRHWQYHSIHPSGVEEFSVGALNDENSRRGVPPGSKRGTDPDGLVLQPYTYAEPTGGFLHVTVSETGLSLAFHDDTGKLLHEVTKTP